MFEYLFGFIFLISISLGLIYLSNKFKIINLLTGKIAIVVLVAGTFFLQTNPELNPIGHPEVIVYYLTNIFLAYLFSIISMLIYVRFNISHFKANRSKNVAAGMFIVIFGFLLQAYFGKYI